MTRLEQRVAVDDRLKHPARKVGTHRRVPLSAVRDHRERMIADRRRILDEMVREADELGLYD